MSKAFTNNNIDEDMIEPIPAKILEVFYEKTKIIVNLGNVLSPRNARDAPFVTYEADPKGFYTLSMSDIDVSGRNSPNRSEWSHWLVVNIPGWELSNGEVLHEYVGPVPAKSTGIHRNVFLVFKQPQRIRFKEPKHPKTDAGRNFSVVAFSKKYNMGNAIAGNFFISQFDDSVTRSLKEFTTL